jgi:DNA polymerase elongation subunit (family B)
MKVPLSVYSADEYLLIYRNGGIDKADFPFKPFLLIESEHFPSSHSSEIWTKVPENEERKYKRIEFNSQKELFDFKKRNSSLSKYIMSNQYLEQLYISQEDFMLNYPHTNDLTIMFFDIETATFGDGLFSKPLTCPILCIGYSIWKYTNDGKKHKVHQEICKGFDLENMTDKVILDKFFDGIQEHDPDIIAGYYSEEFDMPYIVERAQIVGSDLKKMCRGGREPSISDNKGNRKIRLPGRIHFDILTSNSGVVKDQTLFGIKSRSLKEMARWYKIKRTIKEGDQWIEKQLDDIEIKEDIENTINLFKTNVERLYAYQDDDVYRTEGVGHVYLRNCITLAEMMHVPLENIINMYSSFVPKLFVARHMEKLRLINTETNFNKYNIQNGSISEVGTKYEGATVGLYKDGYFDATWKLDFASQYPSSIQTWNLGPDTTSLVRVEEYTGTYNCIVKGNYNWYRIPTKFEKGKYAYDFIVKVRNDKEGFLAREIKRLKAERKIIKAEMKKADDETRATLNSQQNAIKVIMNSIYGFLGLKSSVYGEMTSAVMVTAMCRWSILKCMQRNVDCLVETDTDGIVVDKFLDAKEENDWLDEQIRNKFHVKENAMELELEGNGERAYFYLMKNYVIENEPGDFNIHGSSLKASRAAKVIDRAVNLGIEYIFNNKSPEDVILEAFNFSNLEMDDFVERVKLSKDPSAYDDPYDYRLFLAKQVEVKTGQIITKGIQMSYVVTKDELPYEQFKPYYKEGKNYTFVQFVNSKEELNMSYYKDLVDKTLMKFGLSEKKWMQTDLFSAETIDKKPIKSKALDIVPMEEL